MAAGAAAGGGGGGAGEVLTEKAWVVGGELIEQEADEFIRQRLGLPAGKAAEKSAGGKLVLKGETPCEGKPASAGLAVKP